VERNKKDKSKKSPKLDIAKQYIRGTVEKQVSKGKTRLKNKVKNITKNQMLDYYEKI